MANRSYAPEDLVDLPVRDADDALVLARQLLTAAEQEQAPPPAGTGAGPLPQPLLTALAAIATRRDELEAVAAPVAPRPRTVKAADRVEDNAVGAFIDWVRSFLRLPEGTPERAQAQSVYDAFLGDGRLGFLREKPEREWAQVEARFKEVVARQLEPVIVQLGGRAFWEHLRAAHRDYGIAVGTTQAPAVEMPPQVRERRTALLQAMRRYVVRVSALIDPDDAQATRRATALLRPISEWDGKTTAHSGAPATPVAPVSTATDKPDDD